MNIEHSIQRDILLQLIHTPKATFRALQGTRDSNKFSYHLTSLESKGLITKNEDGTYSLSSEGRRLSAFIEGDTGGLAQVPTVAVALIVQRGEKYLVQKRLKEPFYGYWSLVSGKINFGWNVEECAKRDLTEETGLSAEGAKITCFEQIKTFEDGKLIHHHLLYLVTLIGISGELKENTHKAENAWMTPEEYSHQEKFPGLPLQEFVVPNQLMFLDMERFMENGRFVDFKVTRKEIFDLN